MCSGRTLQRMQAIKLKTLHFNHSHVVIYVPHHLTVPGTSYCARDLLLCQGPLTVPGTSYCARDLLLCQGPLTVPGTFEWLLVAHRGSVGGYSHQASKPKQTWNAYSLTFHSSYETLFLKVLKIVSAAEQLTTFLLPIAPDPA